MLWDLPADPAVFASESPTWTAIRLAQLTHFYGADVGGMISSHGLDSVFFGLLHYDTTHEDYWNAYDDMDPRLR